MRISVFMTLPECKKNEERGMFLHLFKHFDLQVEDIIILIKITHCTGNA